jgi:hypothetical protein
MPLSYLHADGHKQVVTHIRESWRFELIYTLQGKPDQHATCIPRSVHVWSQTIRISQGQCIAPFCLVPTRLKRAPTPGRNLGDQKQTGPAIILDQLILPPSQQLWSRGERFHPSGYTATSAYWAHILACHRYIQYLLAGVNLSVLNRHRQGPWRCRLSTSHSPTFPTDGPPISTLGPHPVSGYPISTEPQVKWCETPIADPWSFDPSASTEVYIYA